MAKASIQFICRDCGSLHPKWAGKCSDCGSWDALEEYRVAGGGAGRDAQRGSAGFAGDAPQAVPLSQAVDDASPLARLSTGIGELDRVLGGSTTEHADHSHASNFANCGLVPGSAVLIGGDPGIGKSTLMLQTACQLAQREQRVLYVSSEESVQQLRLRGQRLGINGDGPGELFVLADTNLARIVEQARRVQPLVMVIDSIQMIYKGDLPAAPGSVTQLRGCCQELVYFCKATGMALLLVGHVTKQGQLAGPRLLEHMVDAVLYFEGDRYHNHRIIRGIKNRFGNTLEVGLFEMTDRGLTQVVDGSGLLAAEYTAHSGSIVCPVLQGSRCLLVQVQALTATGFLGSAKRKSSGLDASRLAMLIAVLEKRGGLRLADQDIFASSVGGMKVAEPAADLAVALAIAGAHYDRQLDAGWCAFGEIGLGGELRLVQQTTQRFREAARLGFTHILCPPTTQKPPSGAQLIQARTVQEALQYLQVTKKK
jgi:DNA repair protein RadA/Sms